MVHGRGGRLIDSNATSISPQGPGMTSKHCNFGVSFVKRTIYYAVSEIESAKLANYASSGADENVRKMALVLVGYIAFAWSV